MKAYDLDTDLETLMRRWHHTTEFATAAWAEYQALRDALAASDARVAMAHGRWRAAEGERRTLMREIERLEAAEAA
jgi:glyoxylase-like metal-dependent hydrolase (beta-lactamase superfamily II)